MAMVVSAAQITAIYERCVAENEADFVVLLEESRDVSAPYAITDKIVLEGDTSGGYSLNEIGELVPLVGKEVT